MNGFVSDIFEELVYDYGQSFKKMNILIDFGSSL